ncbi:Nuclear factor related to kappa-B-binding protein [Quillaja saponaria]|uniref:Nuclear factor related to kappa-B-binding protein n=1 Tax=Quillaja saponaria TaxID=32244 RepID=A0AAD7Q7L1_QUISA|nr:Nuclear factor related to kappa-B-binding protein [Quillaja saponaria]
MAADQRRKRLNGASIVGYSSREQHRVKRKNVGHIQNDLNINSHISVEWDCNKKQVVAKREQIGISWRDMRPFTNTVSRDHNVLADVLAIPQEIFELDHLTEVLSYEVWHTHLSENERNLLMQFLPKGSEPHQVLQELLSGDNFHFGNLFCKWGTSLHSGDLHPDVIIHREKCLKSDKKAYYSELHKYHNDIIGFLIKLKERWESCKDPEKEIVLMLQRSRNDEKRLSSHLDESRFCDLEENVTATSESCSLAVDEKACSSDNQVSSVRKGEKLQRRMLQQDFVKGNCQYLPIGSDDMLNVGGQPKKGDKLQERNLHCSDGAKYMSYIKISKKQHELVKSMKQSGTSIQSRSLNRVLGNVGSIHVRPYEVFVEEEQKKLYDHWLELVTKDLPAAYANWRDRETWRRNMKNSLEREMKDKVKPLMEDEHVTSLESELQDLKDGGGIHNESNIRGDADSFSGSPQNQSPLEISSLGGDNELQQMNMNSEKNLVISESDDAPETKSECSRDLNTPGVTVNKGVPLSSGGDLWQAIDMPHSYYESTMSHRYTSVSGLSIGNPPINEEQGSHLIDLDSDFHEEETSKKLLHGTSDNGSFCSYPNQERNDLLQSLFKGQGMLSYPQEQKEAGLGFQTQNSILMEDGQYHGHFKEPLQPSLRLEQGQKQQNEVYMPENISQNMYSDGGTYLIPRQDNLTAVNMRDWAVNGVRVPVPVSAHSHSHLSSREHLGQHWFPAHQQVCCGWTGSDVASIPTQSIGSGGDQSLFSVLSQCNQLRSGSPYNSVGPAEQFITSRTYGMVDVGTPRISSVVPQTSHSLDCLSVREAADSLVPDDVAWMSLPHQNSALHDQIGKSYLRSWNR